MRWVVPVCARDRTKTKVDFKRFRSSIKKRRNLRSLVARARKECDDILVFRKVPAAPSTGNAPLSQESPGISSFSARVLFLEPCVPMTLVCAGCTNGDTKRLLFATIPGNAANNSGRLVITFIIISANGPPTCLGYSLRRRFFSLVFLVLKGLRSHHGRDALRRLFVPLRIDHAIYTTRKFRARSLNLKR